MKRRRPLRSPGDSRVESLTGIAEKAPPPPDHELKRDNSEEFVVKYEIKRLSSWFNSWQAWQQRLLVCTVMNCSSKQQLMMLATALEPILHMDFCSILLPPLQSLHLDGVALFQNRRAITHRYVLPEIIPKVDSQAYLNSLPSTFLSKKTALLSKAPFQNISSVSLGKKASKGKSPTHHISSPTLKKSSQYLFSLRQPLMEPVKQTHKTTKKIRKKEPILPAMPLTHPDHLPTPVIAREASFDQMLGLRRQRFSSIPEFRPTVELMKKTGRMWFSGKGGRGKALVRRKTVSTYYTETHSLQQKAEQFKEQLAEVTSVSLSLLPISSLPPILHRSSLPPLILPYNIFISLPSLRSFPPSNPPPPSPPPPLPSSLRLSSFPLPPCLPFLAPIPVDDQMGGAVQVVPAC